MDFKLALISSAAVGALTLAAPAHADSTYVSFFGGLNSLDADELVAGPFTYATPVDTFYGWQKAYWTGYLKFGTNTGYVTGSTGTFKRYFSGTTFAVTYAAPISESDFDSGFVLGAALGRDFEDGWRAELEIAWRSNDLDDSERVTGALSRVVSTYTYIYGVGSLNFFSYSGSLIYSGTFSTANPYTGTRTHVNATSVPFTATGRTTGEVTSFAIMANVWYDFDLGNGSPVKPFVGAGIGAVNLSVEYAGLAALPTNTAGTLGTIGTFQNTAAFAADVDDWTWGWQAAVGLSYEFGSGMRLSAQYRYFSTGDIDVLGRDFGVSSHEGLVGLHIPLGN